MLDLLLASVHTESVEGTKTDLKCVTCAVCRSDYFYTLTVTAASSARTVALVGDKAAASATAAQQTEEKLARRFARRDDPVPCPHCGYLQDNMLAGLRRKYADAARIRAAIPVTVAVLACLGAVIWIPLGMSQERSEYLTAGCILAGVAVVALIVSFFACRHLLRIGQMGATADLFRDDIRAGRRKVLPGAVVLPAVRQQLAEATGFDERVRLRAILERLAAVLPPSDGDTAQAPRPAAEPANPWKRTDG